MEEGSQDAENGSDDKYKVSVRRLKAKTREMVSAALNPLMVLPTDEGLPRDWQGLAELVSIPGERITQLQREKDPTLKVLNIWCDKNPEDCTVAKLFEFFEKLDRFDIIDDIREDVEKDIESSSVQNGESFANSEANSNYNADILTRDDYDSIVRGQGPQKYDAFVLFADEDMDFATKLIDTMEKEYNLKFCMKHRDLIGGTFEHDVIIKLIQERCTRLLVIFSNHFFKSAYNEYFANFAEILGIDQHNRKLIPLCYEPCNIPFKWRWYSMLDYNRHKNCNDIGLFWKKLHDSVKEITPVAAKRPVQKPIKVDEKLKEKEKEMVKENQLKVKKDERVTFSKSLTDINAEKEINQDIELTPSTSSNSLNMISKEKQKSKKKWLSFLHPNNKNSEANGKKTKKTIFSRSSKRKAVALTS